MENTNWEEEFDKNFNIQTKFTNSVKEFFNPQVIHYFIQNKPKYTKNYTNISYNLQ